MNQATQQHPIDREARRAWLASILLQRPQGFLSRFAAGAARWRATPRALRRRVAATAAGAALMLALAGSPLLTPPVHAAAISVGGSCSLVDAIRSANTDSSIGTCAAGSGADTLTLTGNVTLTVSYDYYYQSNTGLPLIESTITIDGAGFTIERDGAAPNFRLMAVSADGNLTLQDVTLSGGYSDYNGGGIYVSEGTLNVIDSTITGNESYEEGGGFYLYNGTMTIRTSLISYNDGSDGGGGFNEGGTLTITDSTFRENYAGDGGGALYQDQDDDEDLRVKTTITNSNFELNDSGSNAGAIYLDTGEMNITDTVIVGNYAANYAGAIYTYYPEAELTITGSTINDNEAEWGGAMYFREGEIDIVNSTISGNRATDGDGGGIYNDGGRVRLTNVTVTDNEADGQGGGIYQDSSLASLTLSRSIVSGNYSATGAGHEIYISNGTATADNYNVFGSADNATADAFTNFTPGASDFDASSDAGNVTLADILETALDDNGGPTPTHDLVPGSPALDLAPDGDCAADPTNGVDQRGFARPFDVPGEGNEGADTCDAGAVEYGSAAAGEAIFVSTTAAGTVDAVAFGPHDILQWDGANWSKWFDGTAAGLMPSGRAVHNINAFSVSSADPDDLIMSFVQNARVVPGIPGKVDGMDLVWWNGSGFELWFDGSDVGLTNKTKEKIDALHVLPGQLSPIGGGSCVQYLLISTQGDGQVPNYSGGTLKFDGTDVLGFCLTNAGANTAGFWHRVLNGKAEGMPGQALTSLSASDDGQVLYLTTKGAFNVDSASGGPSMVYRYDFATGEFSGPLFSAPAEGLPRQVDGLHVAGEIGD